MLFVAVRREYGQAVETTGGLICPVKMSVMSAKVEGRVWRQRWEDERPYGVSCGCCRDIAAKPRALISAHGRNSTSL
jgi:hypothetical protein